MALLADSTGAGRATLTGTIARPEFRIINTGLAREGAKQEDPTDVLKSVLQDLAGVDALCLKYDFLLAHDEESNTVTDVICGYVVTTKAGRELLVEYGDVLMIDASHKRHCRGWRLFMVVVILFIIIVYYLLFFFLLYIFFQVSSCVYTDQVVDQDRRVFPVAYAFAETESHAVAQWIIERLADHCPGWVQWVHTLKRCCLATQPLGASGSTVTR